MRDKKEEFEKLGVQLIGVDPHESWSVKSLLKRSGFSTTDLEFPLLTDPAQIVSATYGVAFQMRIHTELANRPATFIVDKSGVLRYAKRGRAFYDRPTPRQLLEQVRKLPSKR